MKACFAAIVVIQSVIAVFIFQHFWDDCKEVFSGRSYRRHQERLRAQQTMSKRSAADLQE